MSDENTTPQPTANAPIISDDHAKEILDTLQHARITLDYIKSRILNIEFINPEKSPQLTLCVVTIDNGFKAVGKSAPASPENFNADLGRKYAYDNAIKELWPAFGFTLCEVLHTTETRSLPLQGVTG